jgi:hypothetical protein
MELTASFGYNSLTFGGIAAMAFLVGVLIMKREKGKQDCHCVVRTR